MWKNQFYDPPAITFQTQLNREREREKYYTSSIHPPVSYTSMLLPHIYTFSKKSTPSRVYTYMMCVYANFIPHRLLSKLNREREREQRTIHLYIHTSIFYTSILQCYHTSILQYTLYSILYTLYSILYTLYSILYTLYTYTSIHQYLYTFSKNTPNRILQSYMMCVCKFYPDRLLSKQTQQREREREKWCFLKKPYVS